MRQFQLPPFSPLQQLAADEWLLSMEEGTDSQDGIFRVWEVASPFVVLGRGSSVAKEINQVVCAADGIPVLRRTSGGATILAGPGCLMYTVIVRHADDPRFASIDATHDFVLEKTAEALNGVLGNEQTVIKAGTSDLAIRIGRMESNNQNGHLRKISGNAMRRGRVATLYHGTLLYDFDLSLISRYLATAPRQPEYRAARDHGEFVSNLPLRREQIIAALEEAWQVQPIEPLPVEWLGEIDMLVEKKYSRDSWNLRH